MKQFHATRWPTLDRVIVSADPRKDAKEPGDIVLIDGKKWRVKECQPVMQLELTVEEVR